MVDTEEINLKTINILYGQTCFKQTCQNSNKTNDFLTSDKNNIYRLFLLQTKNNMKQNIGYSIAPYLTSSQRDFSN